MRPVTLSQIPLLVPAAGLIAGIAAADLGAAYAQCAGVALVLAIVCALAKRNVVAVFLTCAAVGAACSWAHAPGELPPGVADRETLCTARIISAKEGVSTLSLGVEIDSIDSVAVAPSVKAVLTVLSVEKTYEQGGRLIFRATLRPIDAGTPVPDQFDYGAYLLRNGFEATAMLPPDQVLAYDPSTIPWHYRAQQALLKHLSAIPLRSETKDFLDAVLLGDDSMLAPDFRETLSNVGIAHTLALSGLHVGIIAGVLMVLLYPLCFIGRRLRPWAVILLLWGFALITGMSVSVVRAVIMATVTLFAVCIDRDPRPLNSLLLAAIIILLLDPSALASVGFQMTFTAVAVIILLVDPLNPVNRHRRPRLHATVSYLLACLVAMATAGVVAMFYFHVFPVYFILGNLLSAFLLPVMLCLGLACMAVDALIPCPALLVWLTDTSYMLMNSGARWISALPGAAVDDVYFSPWLLLPCGLALLALAVWANTRRRFYLAATVVLLVITAVATLLDSREFPAGEHFDLQDREHFSMLIHDADSVYLFTTAHRSRVPDLVMEANNRYADYLRRRGLEHVSAAPDSVDGAYFRRRGPCMQLDTLRIAVITQDSVRPDSTLHLHRLYVARGFTGDIVALRRSLRPDTLIITPDVHPRRAADFRAKLAE